MSLNVYLHGPERSEECVCSSCGDGHTRIARECFYSDNITHNLCGMASEAGIYHAIWCPEQIGATTAAQLVETLRSGLALLKSDRTRFEKFNAPNGWGTYEYFVPLVEKYLAACEGHPESTVEVSR